MSARRSGLALIAGLLALQLAWRGFFPGDLRAPWVWFVIATLPLASCLAASWVGRPTALFWSGMFGLGYFCHGLLAALIDPPLRLAGLLEVVLSVALIGAVAVDGLQRRRGRRQGNAHPLASHDERL